MKNNKVQKSSNKPSKKEWVWFIVYVTCVVLLFANVYDSETSRDLTVSVGVLFLFITILYVINIATDNVVNNILERPLNTIKQFLDSPIFIVAFGTIIVLLFLAGVIHFPDMI
ncbi:hypothetical protein [Limosilactobacillus reuteri]|uniref:hypothetical protein n=1 Tax=Limosilactobacillus reuteri TaxID=1598 RepID=UPI001C5AA5D3|nr:hypothetical protein [Limosilactobacillus reuteri]MBW3350660.1 hypothetical protein [Limosilactobacillus reuteri]UUW69703.1 hypothetical protein NUJ10_11735 [Limosilactobacillus reuteri]